VKAALVTAFDTPPAYADFAEPTPADGEQLVTVTAAALHQIVRSLAKGTHYGSTGELPFVPGVDGVGRLADGTRVYFGAMRPPFGSMAERTLTRSMMTLPLPDTIDDVTAAGIANPAMSSWAALHRAQFVAGESVLILGATGASGLMAVQIAKRRGAKRIIAAGRNLGALREALRLGADATIELGQADEAVIAAMRAELATGVNIVLDYLYGKPAELFLQAISKKGLGMSSPRVRYVQIGNLAGANITLPAAVLRSTGIELLGSGFGSASLEEIFAALRAFFAEAATKPFTFHTRAVPLSQVGTAWNAPETGARVVFQP